MVSIIIIIIIIIIIHFIFLRLGHFQRKSSELL